MAEVTNGSPKPNPAAGLGKNEQAPSAAQAQQKRNHRNRRNQTQSLAQLDGTVSDSVTNPSASPRSKKQPKQRQSVAGPAPTHNGNMGNTIGQKPRPVSVGGPMLPGTPAKEQAYAGPTFQASPAPSSLPVPRFFSRSVPSVAAQPSLQARMEGEKTPEKEVSSPEPDVVDPVPRDVQSPLDLFFKADKEEKSRNGSNPLLSPEMAARRVPATEPRNMFQQGSKSIFLRELDGDDEDMPSPRTVPPKRPAPVERAHSSPGGIRPQSPKDEEQREAYTRSLKDLLFNNVNGTAAQNSMPPQVQPHAQSNVPAFNTPSPFHRSASGPNTPAPSTEQQNHYALHYGNRNLSPLFKAARNETPTKPSGLRQELPNGNPPAVSQAQQQPPHPRQMPQIDPNSFSRDYLNQQIRASQPAQLPQFPFSNGVPLNGSAASASFSGPSGSSSQQGVPAGVPSTASPRTGGGGGSGSRDIRSMEDDLRRMLKLNVLG